MFHTARRKQRDFETPTDVREAGMEPFQLLVDAVARWLGDRGDRSDPFETATVLWLALHGLAAVAQTMEWFPLPEAERYIDVLLGRLKPATA
jgi:hypothetical protein